MSYVNANESGWVDPALVKRALQPNTKLVVLIHASNVTGTIQPIADVGQLAHEAGALFLVDAAQTAGHLPICVKDLPVDVLACAGHKGLLGPLGTGLLYLRPGIEEQLHSLRQGGTGSQSETDQQPDLLPDKYESGNHNAPGLFGLEAALAFLQQRDVASIRRHEVELLDRLHHGLSRINGLRVIGKHSSEGRVGVVSVTSELLEPHILASLLDETFGIQTRAGLHCAPGAHKNAGTFETGGTVRFSVGPFNSTQEIDTAITALDELTQAG